MALRQLYRDISTPSSILRLTKDVYKTFIFKMCTTTPDNYKFAKSHEWVSVEGDDVAKVGISNFAQKELGEVVYVELPEAGATVTKGETFGVVESVKAASELYAPVSGEVTESNSALSETPGTVNKDPFEEGWIMKVKMSNSEELDELMDSQTYDASCQS